MKTRTSFPAAFAIVTFLFLPVAGWAENEIGFIEKFALAPDREKVLGELIPGSEEFYFFHALHYQNTRNDAKLADVMKQWKDRFPNSDRRKIIENREALLTYDANPQKTLAFLRERLGLQFNHQQEARDRKPNLPSTLDAARVSREVFEKDSLANDRGMDSFSIEALESLVRNKVPLSEQQRRALLTRIDRPDVPGLLNLIVTDLRSKDSGGFGQFNIHRALLTDQLEALAKQIPALAQDERFVFTKLRKLAPSADVDIEFDAAAREAWLERVWDYAKTLPPAFNSLKARILYRRLDSDRRKGVYDRARFLEYLKLPRPVGYVNPKWLGRLQESQPACDLNADLSEALLADRPVGNDEALVREYFLHLFAQNGPATVDAMLAPWVEYVRDTWLKPVLAEAMITSGKGNPEQWASLLTPTAFQKLKDRVDIEFVATNPQFFKPALAADAGDDVQIDVIVKNTPKLIVNIYEMNALNFFLTQKRQLNTDLNLDGLVANSAETHTFDTGPFKRTRQTFKFPALKGKRGAWIIEFIGGGRSSRALVRVGQWQLLQVTGPLGDLLTVLDERGEQVKNAVAWLDGRKLTGDGKLGHIVVPFTQQPGMRPIVLADPEGSFATLTQFEHHAEEYRLDAQFHIEREQLLARREATLAVRVALMLGESHLDPALLIEPKLTVTSTTLDGISTTREFKDLKLTAGAVLTQEISVPERLAQLAVTLTGKVDVISAGGEKRDLSAGRSWSLNGIDKTDATNDGHLAKFGDGFAFDLFGRNGEPLADQQVVFTFKHREFARPQNVALRTDEKGRVALGALPGIASVSARIPNGRQSAWELDDFERTWPAVLHVHVGDAIKVPATASTKAADVSLLSLRAGTFVTDQSAGIEVKDGFIEIKELAAGDYSLRLRGENRDIAIKVTAGRLSNGWFLGTSRNLEAKSIAPLQITNVTTAPDAITVKLANTSPFTRVHVAASRFEPGRGIFGDFGNFTRFGAASGSPARLPNLYAAGREIGDEYRYILDRRYQKIFPGNMLTRPGLLLNPWDKRSTDIEQLALQAGQAAGSTRGDRGTDLRRAVAESAQAKQAGPGGAVAETILDFLAAAAPALYNLLPGKDGVVRIDRKALGDRQQVQIYAEDLTNAVWRSFALTEADTKFTDLRLARSLDPVKPFTQKKEITVMEPGRTLTLADILTSEFETYDTLGGVFSLLTTLNGDATLAKFAWVLEWPKLKDDEKRAKYSEFACHELNFFLAKKDPAFFERVIQPYLRNKKDKTFMDDFLIANDLAPHLQPWAYGRLNIVERALLAQRIRAEAPGAARHLRELWEMIPPKPDEQDRLFETALRGRALQAEAGEAAEFKREKAKGVDRLEREAAAKSAPAAPAAATAATPRPGVMRGSIAIGRAADAKDGARQLEQKEAQLGLAAADKPMEALGEARKNLADEDESRVAGLAGRLESLKKMATTGAKQDADGTAPVGFAFFGVDAAKAQRELVRAYYRQLGPTKEWAENNYYRRPIGEQNAGLITVNAFWRDYAAWVGGGENGAFISPNAAEASRNFPEMLLALAVLDLPFDAPKHTSKADGTQFNFTASGPVVVYHKEIKPAVPAKPDQAQLLVSQSFFRQSDRYRQEGNEKFEKYVTGEFLTGAVYGANVVVTNPTSSAVKAEVLLQIPQGTLPVLGSKATDSRRLRLEPYTTKTFEYFFYFPATAKDAAKFPHYPVNVAIAGASAAAAKPFEFNVVAKLTQFDKASWDYVSQYGTDAEVFTFIEQNNIEALDLVRVAWRCRQGVDFFRKLLAVLQQRHVWNDVIYSYAVVHNDAPALRQWLKHRDDFIAQCGPYLASKLLLIDPIERRAYEHLEYSPLVNQRAHRLGSERRIANPAVLSQYQALLRILAHKAQLDAMDSMSVTYHLFLQDRTDEALARFRTVDPNALVREVQHDNFGPAGAGNIVIEKQAVPTQIQYAYLRCYADFYEGNLAEARGIAAKFFDHPVARWRNLFAEVGSQLDEIEGKAAAKKDDDKPDREKQQAELAATEPVFDFKVENKSIALTWKNLGEVAINYYLMDPEFSFSSNPFVSQDASRFSIIKPSQSAKQALPAGKDALDIPLPGQFAKANVLVEVVAAGQRRAQAYHANTLKLTLAENYGRIEARDSGTDKPVSKAYVKVYARLKNGTVRFFKDGYTDLRGRFDYASLNAPENVQPAPLVHEPAPANGLDYQMLKPAELNNVEKLAILLLSDTNGAAVREVNPPRD